MVISNWGMFPRNVLSSPGLYCQCHYRWHDNWVSMGRWGHRSTRLLPQGLPLPPTEYCPSRPPQGAHRPDGWSLGSIFCVSVTGRVCQGSRWTRSLRGWSQWKWILLGLKLIQCENPAGGRNHSWGIGYTGKRSGGSSPPEAFTGCRCDNVIFPEWPLISNTNDNKTWFVMGCRTVGVLTGPIPGEWLEGHLVTPPCLQ